MSYDRFDAEKDGFIAGLTVAIILITVFALGHWIGRTNAEKRIVELSKQSHLSERLEAKEAAR